MMPAADPIPCRLACAAAWPRRAAGRLAVAVLLAAAAEHAAAQASAGKALRADHPLIGAWALHVPDGDCTEVYRISREGTSLVTSAEEVAQTRFEISDQPDARGYFKWVDTIFKDNGKKDCSGQVTKTPRTTTSYIMMNATHKAFISCQGESTRACIGPFVRIEGGEI